MGKLDHLGEGETKKLSKRVLQEEHYGGDHPRLLINAKLVQVMT